LDLMTFKLLNSQGFSNRHGLGRKPLLDESQKAELAALVRAGPNLRRGRPVAMVHPRPCEVPPEWNKVGYNSICAAQKVAAK